MPNAGGCHIRMIKKLLVSLLSIVIAPFVLLGIHITVENGYGFFMIILLAYFITGVIFGTITKYISGTKGYEGGFAWGFWLGLIGLLVVSFRANLNDSNKHPQKVIIKVDDAEKIEKLAKLHQQGILTDEEFNQKKADILARM